LDKFHLLHQVITFIKDEGTNNLIITVATLHSIIDYEPLKICMVYEGTCFGYVIFKACWYATNDDKNFVGLKNVSVKESYNDL